MQVQPLEAVTFVSRGTDCSFTLFFSLFLDSEREADKDEPSHALDVRFTCSVARNFDMTPFSGECSQSFSFV